LDEMKQWWTRSMNGSVSDSLDLFYSLRRNGVGAHSWV